MGPVIRGIAATVGMAREHYLSRKDARKGEESVGEENVREAEVFDIPSADTKEEVEVTSRTLVGDQHNKIKDDSEGEKEELEIPDEALPVYGSWELDEAQDKVADSNPTMVEGKLIVSPLVPQSEIAHLAEKFASMHPVPDDIPALRLDCSIILPQRRPNTRKRGFVRAYAPVLAAKGISEDTFLDFIDTFNVASQANPLIQAVNMASFATFALSPGIGTAISEAIRLAVDVSTEAQSRYRTNRFLDQINKLWFLPRGLICFPMIWKPGVSSLVTGVAFDNTAQQQSDAFNVDKRTIDKFKAASGTSRGNVQFPDAAPLTFPILDKLADSSKQTDQTMKQKLMSSMKATNEYFDRRDQVKYAMLNPHSGLSHLNARPEFRSRYSDPSHPASSGSLLGLITGGAISTSDRRLRRRQNQKGGFSSLLAPDIVYGGSVVDKPGGNGNVAAVADFLNDARLSNVIRTMRGKQVLYLVIVDAPSREEVAEAQRLLDEIKGS